MILGIITAVIFLLMVAKFATKRLPFKKMDRIFLKFHKVSSIVLLLLAIVHMVLSIQLLKQRPISLFLLGILLLLCIAVCSLSHIFKKKLGKKWIVIHRFAALLMCVCLIGHIIVGFSSFNNYKKAVQSITFETISVEQVADGTYEGEYNVGYIYAKVRVTVAEKKITQIELVEHRNEKGSAAEQITQVIISKQSLDVDSVSGATNSSKVIRKAVENALMNALKNQ